MQRAFIALVVVGIWIPLIATVPMLLGGHLWQGLGFETELPVRHLVQVALCSVAVIAALILTKKTPLLRPRRPQRPAVLLLFLPIVALNLTRGPLVDAGPAFWIVTFVSTLLTGFWEEFCFRGLIQDRLAVLGSRAAILVTAVLFGLVHVNAGWIKVAIALGLGLAFGVARRPLGMWPLVPIHTLVDFNLAITRRQWEGYQPLGWSLVAAYGLVSLGILARRVSERDPLKGHPT